MRHGSAGDLPAKGDPAHDLAGRSQPEEARHEDRAPQARGAIEAYRRTRLGPRIARTVRPRIDRILGRPDRGHSEPRDSAGGTWGDPVRAPQLAPHLPQEFVPGLA